MRGLYLLPFVLSSCVVGPDYVPPDVCFSDEWHAHAFQEGPLETWWEVFQDPLLDHYVALAVGNNPSLFAAESHILQARALKVVAASALFPQISADTNAQRLYFSKNGPLFAVPVGGGGITPQMPRLQNLFNATLDATWEIDLFGKTQRAVEQAEDKIGFAIAQKDDVLVSILAETARNYLEVRGLQARGRLVEKNISLLEEVAKVARARYEKGLTDRLDEERVGAELATMKADLPLIISGIYQGIYALSVLVGLPPEALLSEMLPDAPLPAIVPNVGVGLRSDLLRRRPDVRMAERNLAQATAQVGIAVASFFPTITLSGDIGYQSLFFNTLFQGASQTWAYGADVNLPIYSGGALVGNFNAAKWGANEAAWQYQMTLLAALQDAESALVAYDQELKTHMLYHEAAERTSLVFSLSEKRYASGLINLTDLLDSEREAVAASLSETQSHTAVLLDVVRLYKALGGGWESFQRCP